MFEFYGEAGKWPLSIIKIPAVNGSVCPKTLKELSNLSCRMVLSEFVLDFPHSLP